jgi:hypothetical protein
LSRMAARWCGRRCRCVNIGALTSVFHRNVEALVRRGLRSGSAKLDPLPRSAAKTTPAATRGVDQRARVRATR